MQISTDSGSANLPPATDSFAWKDTTLERQLKELKENKFSDAPDPRAGREGANDKGLDKSLQNWASKPLPKVGSILSEQQSYNKYCSG